MARPVKIFLRLLCIVIGALVLSFIVTKIVLAPLGHWYEMTQARGESDLGKAFLVALVVQLLSFIGGGWLGNWVFRKWLQRQGDRQNFVSK